MADLTRYVGAEPEVAALIDVSDTEWRGGAGRFLPAGYSAALIDVSDTEWRVTTNYGGPDLVSSTH